MLYPNSKQSVQLSSIKTAVQVHRQALLLRPAANPKRPASLISLTVALTVQFHVTKWLLDLDEAIRLLLSDTLLLRPSPDPDNFRCLLFLCFCHCLRYNQTANPHGILRAFQLHCKAKDEDADA